MSPRYGHGDTIRVRADAHPGHHRTPWFVKGKTGRIQRCCGTYFNPESRAYGGDGLPRQSLYAVEFSQAEIWGDEYRGPDSDTLLVDLYEHWLIETE